MSTPGVSIVYWSSPSSASGEEPSVNVFADHKSILRLLRFNRCKVYDHCPVNRKHPSFCELVLLQKVGFVLLFFNGNSDLSADIAMNAAIVMMAKPKTSFHSGVVKDVFLGPPVPKVGCLVSAGSYDT